MHATDESLMREALRKMDAISRRRFLTLLSASTALMAGTSCAKIDRGKIIPYTRRPSEIIPGVAAYYASTFQEGLTPQSVLVKTREGRPIHIEPNTDAIATGKVNLRAIGDLLGLYDPDRMRGPMRGERPCSWKEAEDALSLTLSQARSSDKPVLFMTGALISPTQKALLRGLENAVPSIRHISWEPLAPLTETAAMKALYGSPIASRIHLERADVIISFQADFLGEDPEAPSFIKAFSSRRTIQKPSDPMNRLWAIEGKMSLTGANADHRIQARPSRMACLAFAIANLLHTLHSLPLPAGINDAELEPFGLPAAATDLEVDSSLLKLLAADLARCRRSSVVLAGPALPQEAHIACHFLNCMLESENHTIQLMAAPQAPSLISFKDLANVFEEAADGRFAAAVFWETNPAYAFPVTSLWKKAIARIPESYRISLHEDETARDCHWRLPQNHWLESWGDFERHPDRVYLRQPVIAPLHQTRQAEDLLLACLKNLNKDLPPRYYDFLRDRWRMEVYSAQSPVPFDAFWNAALHDGGVIRESPPSQPLPGINADAIRKALVAARKHLHSDPSGTIELILSPASGLYDGRYGNNGWLQELPDPVTKATWVNPLLLSEEDAKRLHLRENDLATIATTTGTVTAPVVIQPGQCPGVAGLALGYGRRTGNVAAGIGSNGYTLIDAGSDAPYLSFAVKIANMPEKRQQVPKTQGYTTMQGRDLARSWTVGQFEDKLRSKSSHAHHTASLIPEPKFPGHKWGMVVDLSACVGCSACVLACQSENNIPVVGPEQVQLGRHMHWVRIDRYYEGDPRSPSVIHQPMLCQQCDNAPCEIVCPVNATTHSPDGLNQMVYNRCVGTRYCSNNCPFKVRRFNFLDYTSTKKEPEILAMNPEVTVRPRGVMEKCTFCVQRIQNAKQKAKLENRPIADGEIQPACAAACPAGAIVFGDLNDTSSRVAKLAKTSRNYRMLEELGIRPSVTYLADIRNPATEKDRT